MAIGIVASGWTDEDPPAPPVGPEYWAAFAKANAKGWTDPSFFPIGVWLQAKFDSADMVGWGINVMVGVNNDGLSSLLAEGNATGMFFICQPDDWTAGELGSNPWVVGHLASDEVDMNEEPNAIPVQTAIVNSLRARADGRFIYANYGKGSLGTFWSADDMPELVQMVDVCSDDVYWFTDPYFDPSEPAMDQIPTELVREAANYGWTVDQMLSFADIHEPHPYWHFVELGHPFGPGDPDPPDVSGSIAIVDIEGAVWHSIVHGATGIVYFNHSFEGPVITQNVLRDDDPDIAIAVTAINARIASLATILNSPTVTWAGGSNVSTMRKDEGDYQYVFAVTAMNTTAGSRTVNVPVTSGTVTVVGEARTLTASSGHVTDTFATESVMHVYRTGGPTALFSEDWTGSNGSAWNATRWPTIRDITGGGAAPTIDVQSNQGHYLNVGDTPRPGAFSSLDVTDFDMTLRVRIPVLTGSIFTEIGFRITSDIVFGSPDGYAVMLAAGSGGNMTLFKIDGYSNLGDVTGIASGSLDKMVRIQCVGTAISVKQWDHGTTEPGAWDIEVTDATYTTGPIMLASYTGSGDEVFFDELVVNPA